MSADADTDKDGSAAIHPSTVAFGYLPLESRNHFRLLRLHAGPEQARNPGASEEQHQLDQLRCTLYHVDISQKPLYAAVSYTWEHSAHNESLLACAGHSQIANYGSMRYASIKIDEDEKIVQVRLMSTIFYSASYVVAFLWDQDQRSRIALRNASRTIRAAVRHGITAQFNNAQIRETNARYYPKEMLPSDDTTMKGFWLRGGDGNSDYWQAIKIIQSAHKFPASYVSSTLQGPRFLTMVAEILDLYNHQWFTRRWVAPETVLAQSLILYTGEEEMPLRFLDDYESLVRPYKDLSELILRSRYAQWASARPKRDTATTILQTMRWARSTECSLAHDKVFALIPLSTRLISYQFDYHLTLAELACYALATAVQYEGLEDAELFQFAVLLSSQFGSRTPLTSNIRSSFGGCSLTQPVKLRCQRYTVRNLQLESSMDEQLAHAGRRKAMHLPVVQQTLVVPYSCFDTPSKDEGSDPALRIVGEGKEDVSCIIPLTEPKQSIEKEVLSLSVTNGTICYRLDNEDSFSVALASSQPLIEAPASHLQPNSAEENDVASRDNHDIGLTLQHVKQGDQIWRVSGSSLGIAVQKESNGHLSMLCLTRFLAASAEQFDIPRSRLATRLLPDAQTDYEYVYVRLSIPTVIRLAHWAAPEMT